MGLAHQRAAQYASQAVDTRTEQHDADGFRSRKWDTTVSVNVKVSEGIEPMVFS